MLGNDSPVVRRIPIILFADPPGTGKTFASELAGLAEMGWLAGSLARLAGMGWLGWLGWAGSAWPQNSDKQLCRCDCQIAPTDAGNVLEVGRWSSNKEIFSWA